MTSPPQPRPRPNGRDCSPPTCWRKSAARDRVGWLRNRGEAEAEHDGLRQAETDLDGVKADAAAAMMSAPDDVEIVTGDMDD